MLQQRRAARREGLPGSPPCAQEPTAEGAWQTWRPSVQASTASSTVRGNRLFSKTPGSSRIVVPSRAGIKRFTPEGRDVAAAAASPYRAQTVLRGPSRPGSLMPWASLAKLRGGRGPSAAGMQHWQQIQSWGRLRSEVSRASTPRRLSPRCWPLRSPRLHPWGLWPLAPTLPQQPFSPAQLSEVHPRRCAWRNLSLTPSPSV